MCANCHTTWKCEIELQKREFSIETSTFFRLRKIRNENRRRDRGKEREMERKRKKKDWQIKEETD